MALDVIGPPPGQIIGPDLPEDSMSFSYGKLQEQVNVMEVAVPPASTGILTFDSTTNSFKLSDPPGGVFTVGVNGGMVSGGVQEYDVRNLIGLLTAPFATGNLRLTVNEVREAALSDNPGFVVPPDPDLHFDVILYAPADLALSAEDLTRKGERIGSLHVEPRRDPTSLELDLTPLIRQGSLGTFGIRLELRGTPLSSGPGDEGPEERQAGRNVNGSFTMDLVFDTQQ